MKVKLLTGTTKKEIEKRIRIIATACKLSRANGTIDKIYKDSKDYEKNLRFIKRVLAMGHESVAEHDSFVFSLKDVSPVVEQILIEERIASFTIKSRREVDFGKAGFYVPTFRDENYKPIANNRELVKKYLKHMKYLYGCYDEFLQVGVKKEDARFILPYSFHSNIEMGINARTLKNLTVRFLRGKESKIAEVRELGEAFYEIIRKYVPYYEDIIARELESSRIPSEDLVKAALNKGINDCSYEIPDKVQMTDATDDADKVILINALMRTYNYDYAKALKKYNEVFAHDLEYQKEVMRAILENGGAEFAQVNFGFDVPISLAVLTHLTRHRTHKIHVPDFVPIRDLKQYKIPPTLNAAQKQKMAEVFAENARVYQEFVDSGVCQEDLVYFYLSGTMLNVKTNMDGKTLSHIARLRICNKAQWEIRNVVREMRSLVLEKSPIYASTLGPDCEVFLECHEGRESCGKVNILRGKQCAGN